MSTIRKRKNGKWQVIIRKKNYPHVTRTFLEKGTATKWSNLIETQMDRKIFQDMSGAESTTLSLLVEKYRDEIVPDMKNVVDASRPSDLLLHCQSSDIYFSQQHVDLLDETVEIPLFELDESPIIDGFTSSWFAGKSNARSRCVGVCLPISTSIQPIAFIIWFRSSAGVFAAGSNQPTTSAHSVIGKLTVELCLQPKS